MNNLKLFTDFEILRGVDRVIFTRFLEDYQAHLSPAAGQLLQRNRSLSFEEFCRCWSEQFKTTDTFGEPFHQALSNIETLAQPSHDHLYEQALQSLPPGYTISDCRNRLHKCVHLWIISQNTPGVIFPSPAVPAEEDNEKCEMPYAQCPIAVANGGALRTETLKHGNTETLSAAFSTLASLSPADYDRLRKPEAKRLGLRLSTLDSEVERCREANDEAEADKVFLAIHDPWPEPISPTDAPALFDAVLSRFNTYAFLPDGAAAVCTAFLGHTHAFSAFHYTPRINILSDRETCGKTTLIKVIASMAPKPFRVHNLRPPVVYRVIDKRQPTVLLDEIETFLPLYRELLGLLNAGNSSDSCVPRCEGRDIRAYKAFAPVVLAGIGDLSRTLRSRSILIRMTEAPPTANLTRFDSANLDLEKILARKLARWAADNLPGIAAADPVLPPEARNRLADNWRPLFQIARVIGARWSDLITAAFHSLNQQPAPAEGAATSSSRHSRLVLGGRFHEPAIEQFPELIPDLLAIFEQTGQSRLASAQILSCLAQLPARPYQSIIQEHSCPERWLAKQLRPKGIHSRQIWHDGTSLRGYRKSDLLAAAAPSSANPPP